MTSILIAMAMLIACDNKISYDDYDVTVSDEIYTAIPANEFLASIGMNSSIDTRGENVEKTLECMQYLGARWIRSGYGGESFKNFDYLLEGMPNMKFSIGIGSGENNFDHPLTAARYLKQKNALIAMEGANEPNNWTIYYGGAVGGGSGSWIPVAKMHNDFYELIKSDPILKDVDVWTLTEAGAQTDNAGLQFLTIPEGAGCLLPAGTRFADVVNVHNYFIHPNFPALQNNQTWVASDPSSACKVDGLYGNNGRTWAKGFQGYTNEECMMVRKVTTETGTTIGGEVTEEIQGLMYMSCYLAQFARGWEYTSMYILRDRSDEAGNQTFGFYTTGYEPRLSAHYLHNLTTILKDDTSIDLPGRLSFSIPDKPECVHYLFLQKNDGTFALVVWGERYQGGRDNIVVKLGKKFSAVKVYDPTKVKTGAEDMEELLVTTHENADEIPLVMTNHPYVLLFK